MKLASGIKMERESGQKLTKKKLQENIKKLQKDLEEKTKLAEERLNQLMYLQADFENYKKKFEKERENIIELSNESLIKELLVIIDDLEMVLKSMENNKDREGIELLYKKFLKILENYGLKRIDALNKKFDPYYHEAISKEKSDKEDGTIIDEIQPGYMLKSKIIRHSKVKVAQNLAEHGYKNG